MIIAAMIACAGENDVIVPVPAAENPSDGSFEASVANVLTLFRELVLHRFGLERPEAGIDDPQRLAAASASELAVHAADTGEHVVAIVDDLHELARGEQPRDRIAELRCRLAQRRPEAAEASESRRSRATWRGIERIVTGRSSSGRAAILAATRTGFRAPSGLGRSTIATILEAGRCARRRAAPSDG